MDYVAEPYVVSFQEEKHQDLPNAAKLHASSALEMATTLSQSACSTHC